MAEASGATPSARHEPLAGERVANRRVTVTALPPAARLTLRAGADGAALFAQSLGFALPDRVGRSTSKGTRTAMMLGPDEFMVLDMQADAVLAPKLANPAFSAVDVGHRNVAFSVVGPGAADTINAGCPRDLRDAAFPVGACARTILGKAEILLARTADDEYHVECWRSFAPYVFAMLRAGARDAAHG